MPNKYSYFFYAIIHLCFNTYSSLSLHYLLGTADEKSAAISEPHDRHRNNCYHCFFCSHLLEHWDRLGSVSWQSDPDYRSITVNVLSIKEAQQLVARKRKGAMDDYNKIEKQGGCSMSMGS